MESFGTALSGQGTSGGSYRYALLIGSNSPELNVLPMASLAACTTLGSFMTSFTSSPRAIAADVRLAHHVFEVFPAFYPVDHVLQNLLFPVVV